MSYKYSKGETVQGDIKAKDDADRDTKIDFEEDYIGFETNGSATMVVSGSKVGIGITSPTQNLHVVGTGNTTLRVQGSDGYYGALNVKGGTGDSAWLWQPANTSELRFFTVNDDRMTILGTGEIGIGTNTPISKLDVAGKIAITSEVSTPSAPADGKGWLYTKTDGKIYWQSSDVSETDLTAGGGGGSTDPAGSDTHIQYNNDGSFGGSSNLTFDDTNNILKTDNITFKDVAAISGDAASGEIVKFGSGTLTAGKLYYLHTDGAWTACDADSATAGNNQLLGIALGSNPTSNGLLVRGMFDMASYFSGSFSSGQPVYISTDAGEISISEITTEAKIRRVVGYCTSTANVIYFSPEAAYTDNIKIPYPKIYFDGSSTNTQIGDNSLTNATITSDNGKYENGFIDFGSSGNTNPALFGNDIDLNGGVYTFSFWFYSKRTGSDWGSVLRRQSTGTPSNTTDYPILIRDSDDELGVGFEPGSNPLEFYSSGYDMTSLEGSATWVHMAVVANGSQSKFYINGAAAGDPVAKVITTSVKELGSYDGNDTQTFAEGIDEFAYWSIALTPDQITKIYNSSTKLIGLVT